MVDITINIPQAELQALTDYDLLKVIEDLKIHFRDKIRPHMGVDHRKCVRIATQRANYLGQFEDELERRWWLA